MIVLQLSVKNTKIVLRVLKSFKFNSLPKKIKIKSNTMRIHFGYSIGTLNHTTFHLVDCKNNINN